jgi:catechol 2,3-dioxygenase-like lactoylglutathione lyase family enzyme
MMVKRIVTNIASTDVSKAKQFYVDILGLDIVMDQGWIATFASRAKMAPQISIATEGGSGTPVPDISVEVDDLEEAKRRVLDAGLAIDTVRQKRSGACGASMFATHSADL